MTHDRIDTPPYGQDRRRNRARRRRRGGNTLLICLLSALAAVAGLLRSIPFSPAPGAEPPGEAREDGPPAGGQNGADKAGWALLLVNRDNPLPDPYEVELTELPGGESVDARIYPALREMFEDMRADGVYPVVASGYRTAEEQRRIMEERVAEYQAQGYSQEEARAEAEVWVARPGTSEHQSGLAVDINADGIHSAGYEVYDWLSENSCRYGFIQRYPAGKTEITGIGNEPWHYRYVGVEAAQDMKAQGFCLEEYLEAMGEREG